MGVCVCVYYRGCVHTGRCVWVCACACLYYNMCVRACVCVSGYISFSERVDIPRPGACAGFFTGGGGVDDVGLIRGYSPLY